MKGLISRGCAVFLLIGCAAQGGGTHDRSGGKGEGLFGPGSTPCSHATDAESRAALAEVWTLVGRDEIEAALELVASCAAPQGCFTHEGAEARLSSALRLKSTVHYVRGQVTLALASSAAALRHDPGSWAAHADWNFLEFMASILGAWDEVVRTGEELLRAGSVAPRLANAIRFSVAEASEQLGDVRRARELYRELGCANAWAVIGPFNGVAGSGMGRTFQPETGEAGEYRDDWGIPRAWRRFEDLPRPWIDLSMLYGTQPERIFYGFTSVHASRSGTARLHIGAGGTLKAWFNGELVLEAETPRALHDDMYELPVQLRAGENQLLLKLGVEPRAAFAGFSARLTGADQEPLSGVGWKASDQPRAVARDSDSAARDPRWWLYEELWKRWEADPSLENALALIAQADHGDYEEDLLRRSPRFAEDVEGQCSVLLCELGRVANGARDDGLADRLNDVLEKREVLTLDGLERRMATLNADNRHGEATRLVQAFLDDVPGSFKGEMLLLEQLLEHGTEREVRAQIEYQERTHPRTHQAALAIREMKRRDTDRGRYVAFALDFWKANRSSPFAKQMLIEAHGSAGDVRSILAFLEELSRADPLDPGPAIGLAQIYTNANLLREAEQAAKEALSRAPDDAAPMAAWAQVLHLGGKQDEARRWYRSALWANPDDWSMRERYLELTGDDGVLSAFERESTDELVAADRRAPAFPDAHAYFVLGDWQRCVLDDYASRVTQREIGRVNDSTGVGQLSQRPIGSVSNSIGFTVDKVFTIKPDGSRRKGEVMGSTVSFTDLEPGDYFELVYTHHVTCLTPMGREVWQACSLAGAHPIVLSRFQLVHPRALALTIRVPSKLPFEYLESDLGSGYARKSWTARLVPELDIEVGSNASFWQDFLLDFTSVEDWREVGQWYERQTFSPTKTDRRVEAKARELVAGLTGTDERICALARYASEQIVNSSPDFIVEAVRPTDAPKVLERGTGDCKDQCTLLLAMARSLGIEGSTALVNTEMGRATPFLPSIRFDHLVAVLEGEERTYWIDPTASYDPARTPRHLEGAQALLLDGEQSRMVEVPVEDAATSSTTMSTHLAIDRDGHGHQQTTVRECGAMASVTFQVVNATTKQRHAELIGSMHAPETGAFFVTESAFPELETLGEELEYSFGGERSIPLRRLGERFLLTAPFQSRSESPAGLELRERKYPFDTTSSKGLVVETVELELPPQLVQVELPEPTELTSPELDYRFRVEQRGESTLVFQRSLTIKVLEVAPERCEEFGRLLSAVAKADRSIVSLAVRE